MKIKESAVVFSYAEMRSRLHSAFVPHDRVICDVGGPSLTRQEFADECDVNTIMARYENFGALPNANDMRQPQYVDFADMPDFHTCMNMLVEAEAAFMTLPAKVRATFGNDAGAFVEFAQDAANLDKMREWGLAPPAAKEVSPVKVEVVAAPDGPAPKPGAGPAPSASGTS